MSRPQRFADWDQLAAAVPDLAASMRRYLQQLTAILRARAVSATPTRRCARSPRFWSSRRPRSGSSRTSAATTSRTTAAGWPPGPGSAPPGSPRPASPTGSARCGCSSCASATGTGPKPRPGCRSFRPTCPARTTLCPKPSTTRPPRNCCAPRKPTLECSPGSWWKCCCAPACGSVSSPPCKLTRSCSSVPRTGCTCRSANCTTTGTCRCTRTWSPSSTTTAAGTSRPATRCCYPGKAAAPWTGTPSPA